MKPYAYIIIAGMICATAICISAMKYAGPVLEGYYSAKAVEALLELKQSSERNKGERFKL